MDIKIIVAAHKKYRMPKEKIYLPVQVGKTGKMDLGYTGDDTGENISGENYKFCELTGMYWAWKNLKADYIGLVHYRRHFTSVPFYKRLGKDKYNFILSGEQLLSLLKEYDLIVPKKRKYYIESIASHYEHLDYTYGKDLLVLKEVIAEKAPEYLSEFETVMNRNWAHMFNMFVMKEELFHKYCEWMFSVLMEVDKRIDVSGYSAMEARTVAYFGEFMLDVWNEKQKLRYKELPVMFMEKQNWLTKGFGFLKRKFKGYL